MADSNIEESPLEHTKNIIDAMLEYRKSTNLNYFDQHMLNNLTLQSATISPTDPTLATLVFSLHVVEEVSNGMGNLHGGAVATIFDLCTSFCVYPVAREGFWDTGHVSRTLNVTYLRPAPVGEDVLVEAEMVHIGKNMCFVKGVMRRKGDGKVLYTCEHNKARVVMERL